MLNYIWAGLIVFSLVFALIRDIGDIRSDTYRNGAALAVTIVPDAPGELQAEVARPVKVVMNPAEYRAFYHNNETPAASYAAVLTLHQKGAELRFPADASFPKPLAKMKDATTPEDDRRMAAEVVDLKQVASGTFAA